MTKPLLYAFPEPLPMARARGVQTIHTVSDLARAGVDVTLFHVPGVGDVFESYGITRPPNLSVTTLSRSLPWPFQRAHSNRLFLRRLAARLGEMPTRELMMVRHLKLAAALLARWPQMRLIYEAHEVFADTAAAGKKSARRQEEALVLRGAILVIANSHATASRLNELYSPGKPIAVVPNGVDWPVDEPRKDWPAASAHVVYAGSLFPWKGVADLVQAAGELPGFTIEILGGDPGRVEALKLSAPSDGAKVVFRGQVPHAAVADTLKDACIAVLPNRAGIDSGFTSPIKLFEYMAAGCALVVSDLAPMHEVLGPEDAIWVPPGDATALAAAIRVIASNPARAREMGERVRRKARSFTWAGRARRLKELMESL